MAKAKKAKKVAKAKKPVKKSAKVAKKPAKKAAPKAKPAAKPVKQSGKKQISKAKPARRIDFTQIVSPLDDRILIQLETTERVTASGLIIPDTSVMQGNLRGIVVAVGRGHRDAKGRIRPVDLRIGDRVLLTEYAGSQVEIAGETLRLARESEVLGVLET